MRTNRIVRTLVCLLLLGAMCAGLLPLTARAEPEKVRIGIYEKENYHTVNPNGRHAGYDHEYLTKIAHYADWEYECVFGTWEACMSMLKSGRIDILGGVERTHDREAEMIFPSIATMSVTNCLFQKEETYAYEDFASYDGMRVGLLNGSNQAYTMECLSEEKGFTYVPVLYKTETDMRTALENGEVDCLFMDNCRDLSDYSILCYYKYTPLYYAVSKRRPDLAADLERALEKIRIQEPEFEFNLYSKYFEYAQNISLTQEERNYVQNADPIQVGLNMEVSALLCRWDKETGTYIGLMPDTLNLLSQRTGLQFELSSIPKNQLPTDFLRQHPDGIVAPAMITNLISHDRGFQLLEPIYKSKMLTITRSGRVVRTDGEFVMAVPERLYRQQDKIKSLFPKATIRSCTSHRRGMEMVASGEVDLALANEFAAAYEIQSPFFEGLQSSNFTDITEDLTLGLSYEADKELVSILTKGILSLSERETRDIVLNDTAAISYDVSLDEFLYNRRYTVALTVIIVVGALFFLEERKRFYENRKKLERARDRLEADRKYQELMFQQANFDELTGLYNQKYFIERANEWMGANPDKVFRFLWVNLRGFRMINDLYGVDAGDVILKNMADCMRSCVGSQGIYGRMYADCFAVCVPEDCEIDFREKCVRIVEYNGKSLKFHVSIGVYDDVQQCRNAARCINYALIALQNGNSTASSPIFYFNSGQLDAMRTRQWITNDMDRALQEEQFQVYLQPQYDMDGRKLVGAEALSRWRHPEKGFIPPNLYIPIFESTNFIHRLSAYMCDHVCRILAEWLKEGKAVPIAINLSQLDLGNPQLIPMLQAALEKYKVPAEYLRLEITESAYADDQQHAAEVSDKLRSLGFRMEMDDFGSGYSSLNMLKDVNVDTIKMDLRFLSKSTHPERAKQIIRSVVQMVHAIGMTVIAEGVETEEDAAFLRNIGCRYVQGYLYGRPMPTEEFTALLAECTLGEKL